MKVGGPIQNDTEMKEEADPSGLKPLVMTKIKGARWHD
jgi:hypothetical protein